MSTMYFAKLNFNSEIYEVYENREIMEDLFNKVYEGLNEKVTIVEEVRKYKFITLNKNINEFWMSGRIVLVSPGVNISYDETIDDIIEESIKNSATYISFFFDIRKEIIAFIPKRDFGHVMFTEMFKSLFESCIPDIEIELYIEKNVNLLKEKIRRINNVSSIVINIVPPNGDKEDFDALFSTKSEEIKETNATKFSISLGGNVKKSINVASIYINKMIAAVSKGYGDMTVVGKDTQGTKATLKSAEDAPFIKAIPDQHKDNLETITDYARAGISEILEIKSNLIIK